MATFTIPIPDAATVTHQAFTVDLSGRDFAIDLRYNEREGFWYLSIADPSGTPIRHGLKIVVNHPLLFRCQLLERPSGELIAIDSRPEPEDPTLETLGQEAPIAYQES